MLTFQSLILLISRICISSLFLWAGLTKIIGWEGTVTYMASKNMPLIPFFLPAAIFLQIAGSLLLLTGYKSQLGAWMLIIFIIPASIIFHNFWTLQGTQRLTEQIMFMKDMATLGGLLVFTVIGPGKFALK